MFPIHVFARAVKDFEATFPFTPLRVYVEALGAVIPPVTDGRAAFAVVGTVPLVPLDFAQERLLSMPLVMTASPDHPLAKHDEIGRASCRERVSQYVSIAVVAVSLKKKIKKSTNINNAK